MTSSGMGARVEADLFGSHRLEAEPIDFSEVNIIPNGASGCV